MKIPTLPIIAVAALFTGTACAHDPAYDSHGVHVVDVHHGSYADPYVHQHDLLRAVIFGHHAATHRSRWKCRSGHWHHGPRQARVHHSRVARHYHGHSHRRDGSRRDGRRRGPRRH